MSETTGYRELRILIVLGVITALPALAVDISLPTMPPIAADLGTTLGQAQLVITVFLAGLALGQIPIGMLADHVGRRPVVIAGAAVFTLCCGVCAVSQDLGQLLAARFVQGRAAAVGPVVARAMVRDLASGHKAARMMAILVTALTAAPLVGPIAGSTMIALSGWRLVFWLMLALGGLAVLLAVRVLPETLPAPAAGAGAFARLRGNARRFFSIRQCWAGVLLLALPSGGYLAIVTSTSSVMADIYGISAEWVGPLFALGALCFMAGSLISRSLVARLGMLKLASAGCFVLLASIAALLAASALDSIPLAVYWPIASMFMLAHGLIMPNGIALALEKVPEMAGFAAAIIGTMQIAVSAAASMLVAALYDHSLGPVIAIMAATAAATAATRWLALAGVAEAPA